MKKTITNLLTHLKVPVSVGYCEQLIASHSDYPSLLSIVDTLNRLGVPNTAARVQKEQLTDLVFPYVLQLATKHGDLLLIKNARDLDKNREKLEDWNGIVLHVEPTELIIDEEHNEVYRRENFRKTILYIGALALLVPLMLSTLSSATIVSVGIALTAIAGVIMGYLLIAKDLGIRFDVVETFCISEGYKNDCDIILKSEGASFFGFIKLSDLVFIFFLCEVVCLAALSVVPTWRTPMLQALSMISVVTIPVIIYSIAYQAAKKSWCKLCLVVDGILVAQIGLLSTLFPGLSIDVFTTDFLVAIIAGSILIAVLALTLKANIEDILALEKKAADNGRVKNTPGVFTGFLQLGEPELPYDNETRLISGDKNAPLRFVMVGNLYCKPCADQHTNVERLVDMYPDLVSVEYRLIRAKDAHNKLNSNHYVIDYWIQNIRGRDDEGQLTKRLFLDWYEDMDLDKFRNKYPLGLDAPTEECAAIEKSHLEWVARQGIQKTPTFFLNGNELPKEYLPADLAIMIPSLAALVKKPKPAVKDFV